MNTHEHDHWLTNMVKLIGYRFGVEPEHVLSIHMEPQNLIINTRDPNTGIKHVTEIPWEWKREDEEEKDTWQS